MATTRLSARELGDGGVTTADLADLAVTDAKVAAANKDGVATTPSLRTLGTSAQQAAAGNDPRLSDTRAPSAHTHGNITNLGAIGATSGLPIITGAGGVLQVGSFGTTAGTFAQGDDSRLSNARVASDVYAWAKASVKPSYTKGEIGLGSVDNTADANKSVNYSTTAGSAATLTTSRSINGVVFNGSADILTPTIYDADFKRIVNPGGGAYSSSVSPVTGALKITLPVGMTNTMLRFTVKIYEYSSGESFEVQVGGYPYTGGNSWTNNPFAYIVGNPSANNNYTVRMGYTAAGKAVIYIGELNTTWYYPQFFVTEVQCGYGGTQIAYTTGWVLGIEAAAFENVTATISNIQVGQLATSTPNALGAAAVGTSTLVAREDHTHLLPTPATLGVPTLTGTGASGTWGINITGSAPWASITGKPTTYPSDTHTHAYLPLAGGTLTGLLSANARIAVSGGSGSSYQTSDLEVFSGRAGGPVIGLHWSGVVASTIGVEANGRVAIRNNLGTGYENFIAKDIAGTSATFSGNVSAGGRVSLSGTYPYLDLKATDWASSFYIQTGIDITGSTAGENTLFWNPTGKAFAFKRGTITDFSISSAGLAKFSSSVTAPSFITAVNGDSKTLAVGGGFNGSVSQASIGVTSGNLHLDPATGAFGLYLNYYSGTGGVLFGSGAGGYNASVTAAGVFTGSGTGLTGYAPNLSTSDRFHDGWITAPGHDANTIGSNKSGFTYSNNAPVVGSLVHFGNGGYGLQFNSNYSSSSIHFRNRNGDASAWNAWSELISSANIASQSVSYATSSGSSTVATSLNSSHYIGKVGTSGNLNTDFQNTPAGTFRYNGDASSVTNSPGGTWWLYQNMRHFNGSNYWGTQVAWGWEDNKGRLATRNVSGGTFGGWVYYLNSANFNTYSPTLTGTGASGTWSIGVTGNAATATNLTGLTATIANLNLVTTANINAWNAKQNTLPFASNSLNPVLRQGSYSSSPYLDYTVYAPVESPTFTGVPSAPTAALGANTTQIATTAFVLANNTATGAFKTNTVSPGSWAMNQQNSVASDIVGNIVNVKPMLECTVANNSYAIGDRVDVFQGTYPTDSGRTSAQGISVQIKSTTGMIYYTVHEFWLATGWTANGAANGVFYPATSNWRILFIITYI